MNLNKQNKNIIFLSYKKNRKLIFSFKKNYKKNFCNFYKQKFRYL